MPDTSLQVGVETLQMLMVAIRNKRALFLSNTELQGTYDQPGMLRVGLNVTLSAASTISLR